MNLQEVGTYKLPFQSVVGNPIAAQVTQSFNFIAEVVSLGDLKVGGGSMCDPAPLLLFCPLHLLLSPSTACLLVSPMGHREGEGRSHNSNAWSTLLYVHLQRPTVHPNQNTQVKLNFSMQTDIYKLNDE